MVELHSSGSLPNSKLILGLAATAGLLVSAVIVGFLGNPLIALIVMYGVAFGIAIFTVNDDPFSGLVRVSVILFAATIIFLCTLSPLPNSAIQGLPMTDRLNYYYVYYVGTNLAGVQENIEFGYLALMSVFRPLIPFEVFLAIAAIFVFASLLTLARAAGQARVMGLVALTLLSYFTFWSGALNVTRQFIAAGVGIWSVIVIIAPSKLTLSKRIFRSYIIVAIAISIHSSAFVFGAYGLLYLLRRYGNRLIAGLWSGNIFVFLLNFLGFPPLSLVPGLSGRLSRYDSSQISDAGLAEFQNVGVSTGNRLDWAVALLAPIILYALNVYMRGRQAGQEQASEKGLFDIALLYTTLCIPFYMLSFLVFGDRLAFYAFLIMPVLIISLLAEVRIHELSYVAFLFIALACVLQMALGIYGYTPKYWLVGV